MSDRPVEDASSKPDKDRASPEEVDRLVARTESVGRKRLFQLIPRSELTKAILLLVLLFVVIAAQRRSGAFIKAFTDGLFGPTPARVQPKAPPTVRMASPPGHP